jgi:AcrR family transcriptional regulator
MPYQTFLNLPKHKQDDLMNAIIDELATSSYEAFNISNIVRKTGIARGSFYQYFKDKDDVYAYFYTYIGQIKYGYFGALFDPSYDMPLIKRLDQIYEKGLRFRIDYPRLVDVARQLMRSPHILDDPNYQKNVELAIGLYESFIINDIKKRRIRDDLDTHLLAEMIMVIFNHITTDKILYQSIDDQTIRKMIENILDILQKGVMTNV